MMKLTPRTTVRELFLKACEERNLDMVSTILSYGADVNWQGKHFGWSGLHWAVNNNSIDLLEDLLATGNVDVNIADSEQETPLMRACQLGQEEMVRVLCQARGVDLNLRDNRGKTALLHAVVEGLTGCVEILKEAGGVDWNSRDEDGESALSVAVDQGYADILEIILSVPAPYLELGFSDINGRNIAQIAVEAEAGNDKMKEVEDQDDVEAVIEEPKEAEEGDSESEVRDAAEEAKAEDNSGDEVAAGEVPMDWFKEEMMEADPAIVDMKMEEIDGGAKRGSEEMKEGAEKDKEKNTEKKMEVELEIGSDFLLCLKMLAADARVNLNIKNTHGNTPLMYCLKTGRVDMARVLLQNPRVDLDTTDRDGNFPENIARKRNLREVLDVMWRGEKKGSGCDDCPVCTMNRVSRV